jgi:NCS1 family nucleobase:cation symporter-1
VIEAHSYDYIPQDQRHGSALKQLPFWFMINATVITLFTGAIGPSFGLGLAWTLVAVLGGSVFGTFFQAFHAAQGPRMGLPQMIQSRVQFGSRGSVIPLAAAVLVAGGFTIFNVQVAAQSMAQVTTPHPAPWEWGLAIVGVVIAIIGYDLIHKVNRWLSLLALANLVLLMVAVLVKIPVGHLLAHGQFVALGFIAQFGASASYQIAIAPIVSDYTRYLPANTGTARVVGAVFGGTLASAIWIEALGAIIAVSRPGGDLIANIASVGNQFGLHLGTVTLVLAAVILTSVYSVSLYSTTIEALTTVESFRSFRSTATLRVICLCIVGALTLAGSLLMSSNVLANFNAFLSMLLYLLIPWTAVNLVDFYFIRKGTYSISDILEPDGGIYRHWNRRGMAAYLLGFIVMIPFFSTTLFTGPGARALHGADISPIIGLVVASLSYVFFMRKYPLAEEMAVVATRDMRSVPTHSRSHKRSGAFERPAPAEAGS